MAAPKKGVAYTFCVALADTANPGKFKQTPTIAAGDFQVSTDVAAFVNLATLPLVSPSFSIAVKISLSAAEMNGDKIVVTGIDAAGAQWDDIFIFIDATGVTIDDIPTAAQVADAVLDEPGADHRIVGSAGEDLHLGRALLANKREHTVSTGVDKIYDDDGTTVLKTMTPTDDQGDTITITPS